MARVNGPLFSIDARGNIAKGTLQFRTDNWGTHAYKPQDPAEQNQQEPSAAQSIQRARFAEVRDSWAALGFEGRAYYNLLAAAIGKMNGWNLYLSLCLAKSIYPVDTLLTSDGVPLFDENSERLEDDEG